MKLSRLTVKCLAWVVLFLGGAMTVGSLLFLSLMAFGYVGAEYPRIDRGGLTFLSASLALMAILCYFIARAAWKHLRKPDVATAHTVLSLASIFLWMEFIQLARKSPPFPSAQEPWRSRLEGLGALLLALGCYLFYRLVLKRLAVRAFPVSDTPTTTLVPGSSL